MFKDPRYCSLGFFRGPREKGLGEGFDHAERGRLGGIGCYEFKDPRYCSLGFFRGPREKGLGEGFDHAERGRLGGIGCYE